ncbi:DUF5776 domain-containing protein, partial [Enterococcus plantarum]|uniref:DUF5776 domain-containing protein n=1 Tax=Enterococcus plantarum TaxID=1077675 RepID=UPI001ACAB33B|nr:hypothetical protein [Enterococcus plantarum]
MASIDSLINWFKARQGKVTYSMTNRMGPDSYDCSSSVYFALIEAGFLAKGTGIGNTDSLFGDLERNGWSKVSPNTNGNIVTKKGDIFIWGNRGASGGASGHTGVFFDGSDNIIHCNYGYNGITINPHDTIWSYNGRPTVTVYRSKESPTIDLSNYYTTNPGFVQLKNDDYYYTTAEFTSKNTKVLKGTIVKVDAIQYSKGGYPRLKTAKGFLTANKNYVQQKNMSHYFLSNPGFIKMIADDFYYTSTNFTTKKTAIKKGVIVKVLGIEFSNWGIPRLKCEKGFLTANKSYVQQQDMSNYFTTNPSFIKMSVDDAYYTSAEFSTKKEPITKGVIVKVLGIEFSNWGIPRLKCEKGFLTANKSY